jgi:hypothetical protein
MTYHMHGLGEIGTFKQYGRATVRFNVSNVHATQAASVPDKIRAMIASVPGVLRVTSCAWQAGGIVKAQFTMQEGTSVSATFAAIRRGAEGIGPQIQKNARVFVPTGGATYQTTDVNPAAPATPSEAVPTEPAPNEPAASLAPPAPAQESESGKFLGLPIWAVALGAAALIGGGAILLMGKKPQTATAS